MSRWWKKTKLEDNIEGEYGQQLAGNIVNVQILAQVLGTQTVTVYFTDI